jgi:hypothetical protein
MHYFTVTSNEGATAIIPIYRRVELLPHYQPPEQLGFFDNSPFIPTPTPEVIIQKVPGPVQTVIQTVTITPSKGQIDAATFEVLSPWIIAGIIVLIGLILMAWVWSAVRRVKHED